MTFDLRFSFDKAGFIRFRRSHFRRYRMAKVLLILATAFIFVEWDSFRAAAPLYRILTNTLFGLAVFALLFWIFWYRETRLPADAARYLGEQELHVGEDGISYRNGEGEGRIGWAAIQKYFATDAAFYLYLNGQSAFTVPRRAFADVPQQAAFEQLLKRNVRS